MPTMLESWCQVKGLTIEGGLIQNEDAVSIEEARTVVCYALRWRHRICRVCNEEFDIMQGGFLYCCEACAPEDSLSK
jgi:hypothetical protein|tara:strand:- start:10396 stop:10626 length:231 start_codon:yes stop_codon:yes gene_type:complete